MKMQKADLADKLKNMKGIVLPKSFEGLQGVLVKDGQLIATNLELTVIAGLPGAATDETFIIPQTAIAYIESLPGDEVEIKPLKKYITIAGGGSSAKFAALDASQFPEVEKYEDGKEGSSFVGNVIKDAISKVWSSADSNSPKPIAQGVLFEGDGTTLNIVAIDGTRASWAMMGRSGKMNMLIPKETLKKAMALVADEDTVTVFAAAAGNKAVIRSGDYTIYTRLLDGSYPDYKSIVQYPDETVCVTIDRKALIGCVNRCQLCTDRSISSPAVMIMAGEYLNIMRNNTAAEFNECVPAQFDFVDNSANMKVGFNTTFLLDALKNCDEDQVYIHYTSPVKPLIITMKNSSLRHLIVPMRLQG